MSAAQASSVFFTSSSTRIGNNTARLSFASRSNAVSTSFFTHQLLIELPESTKLLIVLSGSSIKCSLNFLLHPPALDRTPGEHYEQLVVQLDGFIDPVPEFITDFQILRRVPAPHTLGPQVAVEPLGK